MRSTSQRVLVVDDDDAIRLMVERVLRREQFEVEFARDGLEAIEKLSRHRYDTILLDLMMPRVDGVGVLEFLSQNPAPIPASVILMTASTERVEEAATAGAVSGMLSKPFDIRDLVAQVRGVSESRIGASN